MSQALWRSFKRCKKCPVKRLLEPDRDCDNVPLDIPALPQKLYKDGLRCSGCLRPPASSAFRPTSVFGGEAEGTVRIRKGIYMNRLFASLTTAIIFMGLSV